jgi:DNA-binding NarL/FixJ family response regulator
MEGTQHSVGTGLDCTPKQCGSDQKATNSEPALRSILILSDIRFFREGLAEIFSQGTVFGVVWLAADLGQAVSKAAEVRPQVILVDVALPDSLGAVARLHSLAPLSQIVALALAETETAVIAWAKAGACGYVPRDTSLHDLVSSLDGIVRGEQTCSRKIAASLMRCVSQSALQANRHVSATAPSSLTVREQQVMQLIGTGLSNKEIARRLNIGLGTTKSHVHNVLGKLELTRRTEIARLMNATSVPFGVSWDIAPQKPGAAVRRLALPDDTVPPITSRP